jgi:hypothetical protein
MTNLCATGGSVAALSASYCSCSCASLSLASTTFISKSSINFVHTCAFSSHSFMQSASIFLILVTIVVFVLVLPSRTYGGDPSMLLSFKSSIYDRNPLITSPSICTCSSIVTLTTRGTFGISLYNFWTTAWVFFSMLFASSFSFNGVFSLSSTSSLFFKASSTFPSNSFFC